MAPLQHLEAFVQTVATRLIFTDPEAMAQAALMGLGVALLPMPFALPWLEQGALVRLLPGWYEACGARSPPP